MQLCFRSFTLSLSSLCLAFFPSLGFSQNQALAMEPIQGFPLTPRITGLGMAGDNEVAWGDMMLPLAGNANQVWYVDVQGKTAFETDWLGSAGAGVRQVVNSSSILGAYVFVDRTISPDSNTFWFVSPGIEELGNWIDFRANGYFPTNSKKQYGSTDWADNFGIYDYVTFQGHQQYDILMTQDEEVGWGGDAEIGAKIPGLGGTRAYVGGYHFSFDDASDINGVEGRVELPVNRYLGLTVRDSYDNEQHNTILVGLKLTLGGVNVHPTNPHQAIQERILDPIERNLATLGQGVGEPVQDVLAPAATNPIPPMVERDNIWYFSPSGSATFSGSLADCTMENVCVNTNFNQSTIDGINALKASSPDINNFLSTSPSFYLAPGSYSSLNDNGGPLEFTNDWIWGRSANFVAEQQDAILTGAMIFNGTNNLLNNITLQSAGMQNVAVLLRSASNLNIEASLIGSDQAATSYHTAIEVDNANLSIADFKGVPSEIKAYGNDGQPVTGIRGTTGSVISLTNSELFATALRQGNQNVDTSNIATGIAINGSTLNIMNSRVEATAEVTGNNSGYNLVAAIGANAVGEAGLPFQNNIIDISSNSFIVANAIIGITNANGVNAAVGIGENLVNTSGMAALFSGNRIDIDSGSSIASSANIALDNQASQLINANNMASGIGTNGVDAENAITFNNRFTVSDATITSSAMIGRSNLDSPMGDTAIAVNMAAGIGGNASSALVEQSSTNAGFSQNIISLNNVNNLTATAEITLNNGIGRGSLNFATGIGGNSNNGDARFTNNNRISLTLATIDAFATINGDNQYTNLAAGIGGNSSATEDSISSTAGFDGNILNLTDSSINGEAIIGTFFTPADSQWTNAATGIGGNADNSGNSDFTYNTVNSNRSDITGTAAIRGVGANGNFNAAAGFGGNASEEGSTNFTNNSITITATTQNIKADANAFDNSDGLNMAVGFGNNAAFLSNANFEDNTLISITGGFIRSTAATLTGENVLSMAAGFGSNVYDSTANFTGNDQINVTDTTINVSGAMFASSINNMAVGFGSNGFSSGSANFEDNKISLTDVKFSINAGVSLNNINTNLATGFGVNSIDDGTTTDFTSNQITLTNTNSTVTAAVRDNNTETSNFASGFGANALGSQAIFSNNTILTSGGSFVAFAFIDQGNNSNLAINQATAFGMNSNSANAGFNNNIKIAFDNTDLAARAEMDNGASNLLNAQNNAYGTNLPTTSMTGDLISISNGSVLAQVTTSGPGSNTNTGLKADDLVTLLMNGGSITTVPSSGSCKDGAGIGISGTTDVTNCS